MIPLKGYIPTSRFPLICVTLIMLNVMIFFLDRFTGHFIPIRVDTPHGIVETMQFVGGLTAKYALVPRTLSSTQTVAWMTIFTSMFLHGNWLHIGSNMLYLWIFGPNIEDALGRFRFLMFYFSCGFFAAMFQVLSNVHSTVAMVGASGAIAGVMGAYFVLFPQSRILTLVPIFIFITFFKLPAILIIGYWVLIQFINATLFGSAEFLRGGVAYFAHLGGFVSGMLWIVFFGTRKKYGKRERYHALF